MSSEETRQEILARAMKELKAQAGFVIEGIMSNLYTDYLPHVETDTDANIGVRVDGVIQNLIAGNFKKGQTDQDVWVCDGYEANHLIRINEYSAIVAPLCEFMGEAIKDARIKQLEKEIEHLRQSLSDAYRQY